jgi:hypothetical protein
VVADAVIVEPVSASKFPAIREKNREFFDVRGHSAYQQACESNDFGAFQPNSLNIGTGKVSAKNREFQKTIREFPTRETGNANRSIYQ